MTDKQLDELLKRALCPTEQPPELPKAAPRFPHRKAWMGLAAACLCLVVSGGAFLSMGLGGAKSADSAPESMADVNFATADKMTMLDGFFTKDDAFDCVEEESLTSAGGAVEMPMAPSEPEAAPEAPAESPTASATVNGTALKTPPELQVLCGGNSVAALRGTTSWMYQNEDGTGSGIESDSVHPLEAKEYMVPLLVNARNTLTARLDWPVNPDEVTVRCWSEDSWGKPGSESEKIPVDVLEIDKVDGSWDMDYLVELKDGNYIYEVIAAWTSAPNYGGSVHYGFYTVNDSGVLDISVSYANWAEDSKIFAGALNKDKMGQKGVRHLPIFRFDTLAELEQFKRSFDGVLSMDGGYDEVPSFQETTSACDEAFFDRNSLILVYIGAGSGSYRFGVSSVFCDGGAFCVHVKQLNDPQVVTCDMAGWFLTVSVPDSMIENCTEFDADIGNGR